MSSWAVWQPGDPFKPASFRLITLKRPTSIPLADFFQRYGTTALLILLLVGTYRISDILMGVIANLFYLDVGFTKAQIATYTKFWGLWATLGGGFVGGILSIRYGVIRILFVGAFLAAATNLLFAYVAGKGPDEILLLMVIIADNGSAGIAAAAFVAYLSSLTSVSFTAIQYAIFSSNDDTLSQNSCRLLRQHGRQYWIPDVLYRYGNHRYPRFISDLSGSIDYKPGCREMRVHEVGYKGWRGIEAC